MNNNCLVTKYKAVVDNPNLPVLETMQQITLDFIAKGGNMPMTDAQKLALNHFLYAVGAVDETATWNKVRSIFLPIIATEVSKAILDYKNNGVSLNNDSRFVEQSGCLEIAFDGGSHNLSYVSINGGSLPSTRNLKDSAILVSGVKNNPLVPYSPILSFVENTENNIVRQCGTAGSVYSCGVSSTGNFNKRFAVGSGIVSILVNFSQSVVGYGIKSNGDVELTTNVDYGDYANVVSPITPSAYKLGIASDNKFGVIIDFNAALTDSEIASINDAVNNLIQSF